jgi:hypothetical protein
MGLVDMITSFWRHIQMTLLNSQIISRDEVVGGPIAAARWNLNF